MSTCAFAVWHRFQLLNFPDAHFFVYIRGGNGYGDVAQSRTGGIPGAVGGSSVLYPCVGCARIVRVAALRSMRYVCL